MDYLEVEPDEEESVPVPLGELGLLPIEPEELPPLVVPEGSEVLGSGLEPMLPELPGLVLEPLEP